MDIYGPNFWDENDGDKKSIIDEIKKCFQDKSNQEKDRDIVDFLENYTGTYLIEQFKEYKKKNNSK